MLVEEAVVKVIVFVENHEIIEFLLVLRDIALFSVSVVGAGSLRKYMGWKITKLIVILIDVLEPVLIPHVFPIKMLKKHR